jgi:ligand-binding sensor protein
MTIWPTECTQLLLDAFADLLDVMLVLTDLDGCPVTEVSNPPLYYQLMQETEKGHDLCLDAWGNLGQMHALEPRFISTFGGLLCARALIRVGNELKGMVIAFGIAPQDWSITPEIREEISNIMEAEEERYIASFQAIQPLSTAEQHQVLETLQRIGDILAHVTDERSDLITRLEKISQLSSFEKRR